MSDDRRDASRDGAPRRWRRFFLVATICLVLAIVMGICAIIVPDQVRVVSLVSAPEGGELEEPSAEWMTSSELPTFSAKKADSLPTDPEKEESEAQREWREKADEAITKLDELAKNSGSMSFDDAMKAGREVEAEALKAYTPYLESANDPNTWRERDDWGRHFARYYLKVGMEHDQWRLAAGCSMLLGETAVDSAERDAWWDCEVRCWRAGGWEGRMALMKRSSERSWGYWSKKYRHWMPSE